MGQRLSGQESKLRADHWINAGRGVLILPPCWGGFVSGVGTWGAEDKDGDAAVIWRGAWDRIWDRIGANACRGYQAGSRGNGRSPQQSRVMKWISDGCRTIAAESLRWPSLLNDICSAPGLTNCG